MSLIQFTALDDPNGEGGTIAILEGNGLVPRVGDFVDFPHLDDGHFDHLFVVKGVEWTVHVGPGAFLEARVLCVRPPKK
jgi:hypothetical protein